MLSSDAFIPLEFSISALRQKAPKVLSAIAAALKTYRGLPIFLQQRIP